MNNIKFFVFLKRRVLCVAMYSHVYWLRLCYIYIYIYIYMCVCLSWVSYHLLLLTLGVSYVISFYLSFRSNIDIWVFGTMLLGVLPLCRSLLFYVVFHSYPHGRMFRVDVAVLVGRCLGLLDM
jgi:hypothetical protein